jgi:quinol monooxygenase YgiN
MELDSIGEQEDRNVPTISKDNDIVTLINVFTVDPANQQRLIDLLIRATEGSVRHAKGFVSASLHRSTDGTKVTMYAQWRSAEDYQVMRLDPAPLPFLQEAMTIATFEPGMYEVIQIFGSERKPSSRRGVVPPAAEIVSCHLGGALENWKDRKCDLTGKPKQARHCAESFQMLADCAAKAEY